MSGICSAHQGHDKDCPRCTAVTLSATEEAYYRGWDEGQEALRRNCWTPVENCVLNVYTRLEDAARKALKAEWEKPSGSRDDFYYAELEKALNDIDKLRELNRGMWARDLPV